MKYDIILAGVGGQGVLSIAAAIAAGALEEGLHILQSEVHGMSQRGGAVLATLRISDQPIASPLIPEGTANMLIAMEPLESLRYLPLLKTDATLLTSMTPVKNIANYPALDDLLVRIRALPHALCLDTEQLAREAGSMRTANVVLVGAASPHLPLSEANLRKAIRGIFARKGDAVVEMNLKAFALGRSKGQTKESTQ